MDPRQQAECRRLDEILVAALTRRSSGSRQEKADAS